MHFIRHAEGFHNIGWEQNTDAHLTPRGWAQTAALRRHIRELSPPLDVQVHVPYVLGMRITWNQPACSMSDKEVGSSRKQLHALFRLSNYQVFMM